MPVVKHSKITEALQAVELADLVYEKWEDVARQLGLLGYKQWKFFDEGETEAFVASSDTEVVYAFRGTTSLKDWLYNLDIFTVKVSGDDEQRALDVFTGKVSDDEQRVHEGFYKATSRVADSVLLAVKTYMGKPDSCGHYKKKLTGVGHSLGAACCVLFSRIWAKEFMPTLHIFGCPRTCNKEFAAYYALTGLGRNTFRWVNENDVVCRVPSRIRFHHVGREMYLDWRGQLIRTSTFRRRLWNQIVGRVWAYWKHKDWKVGITRHLLNGPRGYVEVLKRLLKRGVLKS